MWIKKSELLTNNLKICENCKWCKYNGSYYEMARCMLTGEEKGLIEYCSKFEVRNEKYFYIFYY